jgi:hypothetical protein
MESGPCTAVTMTVSPLSPVTVGESVSVKGKADCGGAEADYEFRLKAHGGTYTTEQAFSKSAVWTWNTSGTSAGSYRLEVVARARGTTGRQATATTAFSLVEPVCGCTPATCADLGFNCGVASDGCGNALDCGSCRGDEYCGGGGFDVCGGDKRDAGGCTPQTCADQGITCGYAGDGCGNALLCGTCSPGMACGAVVFGKCAIDDCKG